MHKKILILNFILLFVFFLLFNKKTVFQEEKIKSSPSWVVDLNVRNEKINKIYADIVIKYNNLSNHGFICYEKDKNFRMITSFILHKNLDIGSNNKLIWFWSSSMKPKALYFCFHEDLKKARLKKIFHPNIIKKILGVDKIEYQNIKINEYNIEITENLENNLIKKTIINQNGIKESLIYDYGVEILKIKVIEFQYLEDCILPKKIELYWIEENIKCEWTLENIQLNNNYKSFEIPDYSPKINLSNY